MKEKDNDANKDMYTHIEREAGSSPTKQMNEEPIRCDESIHSFFNEKCRANGMLLRSKSIYFNVFIKINGQSSNSKTEPCPAQPAAHVF